MSEAALRAALVTTRYYALTEAGGEHLQSESERLTEYAALLATLLATDPDVVA